MFISSYHVGGQECGTVSGARLMSNQNDWTYAETEQLALAQASAATPLRPARCKLLKAEETDQEGHRGIA